MSGLFFPTLMIGLLFSTGTDHSTFASWQEARQFQQELNKASVATYFGRELSRLGSWTAKTDLLLSNSYSSFLLSYDGSLIKRRLKWQKVRAEQLLDGTAKLRHTLEFEMGHFVDTILDDLSYWQTHGSHPELAEQFTSLERMAARRQSFLKPGHYQENLEMIRVLTNAYRRLKARWLRYGGDRLDWEDSEQRKAWFNESRKNVYPEENYVLVDTAANRIYVLHRERILLEADCSTGSGQYLTDGERSWTFDTPRGEFTITREIPDPIWRKPDWAFISEGKPVPQTESERLEEDALGEYALDFGDGYFIHGTLYTRLLGEPVTHGCIRMASKDLSELVDLIDVGSKIYIF